MLARVGGHQTVHLRVDGPGERVTQALSALAGVESTEVVTDGGEASQSEVIVQLAATSFDGSPEVAAFLVREGFRLHHLEADRVDLEEAYLRLTENEEDARLG